MSLNPFGTSEASQSLGVTTSSSLQAYYEERLNSVRSRWPLVWQQLKALGVIQAKVTYDGCGDSGQIEEVSLRDQDDRPVILPGEGELTEEGLADLFYDLLEARHPGWENNDGACGEFEWNVDADALHHVHRERFTDYDETEQEGL